MTRDQARLWWQKRRWHDRHRWPWRRLQLHWALAERSAYARGPVHGEALEMLRDGRLEVGAHAFFEPGVWLTGGEHGRIRIGEGTFLNLGVQVAAMDLVDIGANCMLANGCMVTDSDHRFDDPDLPVPWQGFVSKGPTRIGDNTWLGAHVVVTSGVTIGQRCVIGANAVVTEDIPAFSVAVGAPARVVKTIEYDRPATGLRGVPDAGTLGA